MAVNVEKPIHIHKDQINSNKVRSRRRRLLNWAGEKSPYVTFPIAFVVFTAGAVTGGTGWMLAGGAGMGTDVVQNRYFRNRRRQEKEKASTGHRPGKRYN